MRSGTQEPCLWGGVSTGEWGLPPAPDPRVSGWLAVLSASDGFDFETLLKNWVVRGKNIMETDR